MGEVNLPISRRCHYTEAMLPPPPRLFIEHEWNCFIKTVGGKLVSEVIATKNPSFANADYVFEKDNVIAELKCLKENKDADANQRSQIAALFKQYAGRGLIPHFWGVRAINSIDCPADLQKKLYRILARPIRQQIKKANRQIRETRCALGMRDAHGLLLLANDGNFRLEPGQLMYTIDTAIGQQFSAIDTIIVFTVNMSASLTPAMHTLPRYANVWIPAPRIGHPEMPDDFLNRLSHGWVSHVSQRLHQAIPVFEGLDHSLLEQLRYDDRPRPKPIRID
jgi:hypothetical protein